MQDEVGKKDDEGKARWDLLPIDPIDEAVKILTKGAEYYGDNNWQLVPNARERYFAALMRHIVAWRQGKHIDEDGYSHIAHAICNLLFIHYFDSHAKVDDVKDSEDKTCTNCVNCGIRIATGAKVCMLDDKYVDDCTNICDYYSRIPGGSAKYCLGCKHCSMNMSGSATQLYCDKDNKSIRNGWTSCSFYEDMPASI
jgi:hypothetical protein